MPLASVPGPSSRRLWSKRPRPVPTGQFGARIASFEPVFGVFWWFEFEAFELSAAASFKRPNSVRASALRT